MLTLMLPCLMTLMGLTIVWRYSASRWRLYWARQLPGGRIIGFIGLFALLLRK